MCLSSFVPMAQNSLSIYLFLCYDCFNCFFFKKIFYLFLFLKIDATQSWICLWRSIETSCCWWIIKADWNADRSRSYSLFESEISQTIFHAKRNSASLRHTTWWVFFFVFSFVLFQFQIVFWMYCIHFYVFYYYFYFTADFAMDFPNKPVCFIPQFDYGLVFQLIYVKCFLQIASIGFVVVEFCDASKRTSVFASIARWMGRGTTLQRGNRCVVYCWHIQIKHRWILAESIVSFQRKCFLALVLRDAQTFRVCFLSCTYI